MNEYEVIAVYKPSESKESPIWSHEDVKDNDEERLE